MLKLSMKRIGTAVLAGAMVLLAGCKAPSNGREFVKINGTPYYEEEMYANIYYTMGNSFSGIIEYNESATAQEIKDTIDAAAEEEDNKDYINKQKVAFVKQKACDAELMKAATQNNITLDEQEKQKAEQEYNSVVEFFNAEDTLTQIKDQMFKESKNPDQDAKKYLEGYKRLYLSLYNVKDFEGLKGKYAELSLINKVLEMRADQVPDDEEYIKKYYDDLVQAQKTSFEEDPAAFDTANQYGEVICYYPPAMRYVRHILIEYTAEEVAAYDEVEKKVTELEAKEARNDQENADLAQYKTQAAQLTETMDARVKARADEAYGKINAGEDYEEVLKAYNTDASMTDTSSQFAEKGYLVGKSSNMVEEFLTVAMALEKPGDISKPVKSSYGYHIIKYVEKGKEGVVPFEEIKDQIITVAMEEKQQEVLLEYYDSLYDQAMASGQVTISYDALGFDKETYDRLYQEMINTETDA